jgi:hypothetical protein
MSAPRAATPTPSPVADMVNPLQVVHTGVSMTLEELSTACGLSAAELADLQRYGLVTGRPVGGTIYFDTEALIVANLAAGFMRFGVEPRHLRSVQTSANREIDLLQQVVSPMRRQRDAGAEARAEQTARELASLVLRLHTTLVRAGVGRT